MEHKIGFLILKESGRLELATLLVELEWNLIFRSCSFLFAYFFLFSCHLSLLHCCRPVQKHVTVLFGLYVMYQAKNIVCTLLNVYPLPCTKCKLLIISSIYYVKQYGTKLNIIIITIYRNNGTFSCRGYSFISYGNDWSRTYYRMSVTRAPTSAYSLLSELNDGDLRTLYSTPSHIIH